MYNLQKIIRSSPKVFGIIWIIVISGLCYCSEKFYPNQKYSKHLKFLHHKNVLQHFLQCTIHFSGQNLNPSSDQSLQATIFQLCKITATHSVLEEHAMLYKIYISTFYSQRFQSKCRVYLPKIKYYKFGTACGLVLAIRFRVT